LNEKILIVDDEKKMVRIIKTCLEQEGYRTFEAYDGRQALEVFSEAQPDLVVLDVMMPRLDGLGFCREVRSSSRTPIIILSAKSEEDDRLVGLELGADDYVTKPFSMRELVARIRAILRRFAETSSADETICLGPVLIDRRSHKVLLDGSDVPLTRTEFDIMLVLAGEAERVYSRRELMEAASGEFYEGYDRTVDAHIGNIRKKVAERCEGLSVIETVYGVGYRFKVEEKT
jgi:two-component system, OmpR family, alkaline phosphatase synthesis response regulator PhoP